MKNLQHSPKRQICLPWAMVSAMVICFFVLIGSGLQPAQAQTFTAGGLPANIPDGGSSGCWVSPGTPLTTTINVSGIPGNIVNAEDVTINIRLAHTYVGDVHVSITPPGGSPINLIDRLGSGLCGSEYDFSSANTLSFNKNNTNTIALTNPIAAGNYLPSAGTYGSAGNLSALIGRPFNGTWTLTVRDGTIDDLGALHFFSIVFATAPVCPTLATAPADAQITNSACSSCALSGGSISAPAGTPCPAGSTLQYSTNGGSSWDNTAPAYNQSGPAQTIQTRCICDTDNDVYSPASAGVTTQPGTCNPVTAGITGNPIVCGGVTLTATGGGTYAWSGGSTPNEAENFFATSNTYTVTVTGSNGCTDTESIDVFTDIPNVYTTNITACGSYTWAVNQQTYTLPGTYTVQVDVCHVEVLNLTIPPQQLASLSGNTAVCVGGIIGLTATGGNQYQWSGPGGYTNTGASITRTNATTAMSGLYTVTITNNECTTILSATVTVYPIPVATITGASPVCSGGAIALSAPAGAVNYAWSGPGGFNQVGASATVNLSGATSAMSGNYTVTVTGAGGCTASASRNVSVNAPTAATITGATNVCSNAAITLTATTAGVSHQWSGPGGFTFSGATMTRTPAVAGAYTVTVTNAAGCISVASRTVSVTTAPTPSINNFTTCTRICLIASGGNSYAWSGPNGYTTTGTTVNRNNPTSAMWGTYTVTVTSGNCTATASVTVSPCGATKNAGEVLTQNISVYPNPTANETTIEFATPEADEVSVLIYAIDGREVAVLYKGATAANEVNLLNFNTAQLTPGTYFVSLHRKLGSTEQIRLVVVR